MDSQEFAELEVGDIVVGKSSGLSYVITDFYGNRATAVRTVDISNPVEWEVVETDPAI